MDNLLTHGKRTLSVALTAAVILSAIGLAAFIAPQTAHAAAAGDDIKSTSLSTTMGTTDHVTLT